MPRENVHDKGRRYLIEGRITVLYAGPDGIKAVAKGRGYTYDLGWNAEEGWFCGCPAKGLCCHLEGLHLVTTRTATEERMLHAV